MRPGCYGEGAAGVLGLEGVWSKERVMLVGIREVGVGGGPTSNVAEFAIFEEEEVLSIGDFS